MVREFRGPDLVRVRRLIHYTIDACYPSAYPPRAVDFFKRFHSDEAVLARSKDGRVVVIEDAGAIVATGAVVDGEITAVFVAPERQGNGLGGMLMDELEAHAHQSGHPSAVLSVSLPSRGFYEHRGYRLVDECSLDVGEGQRLDYWKAAKDLGRESEQALQPDSAPGEVDSAREA